MAIAVHLILLVDQPSQVQVAGSSQGTLTVGETATYTASYTITQAALDMQQTIAF